MNPRRLRGPAIATLATLLAAGATGAVIGADPTTSPTAAPTAEPAEGADGTATETKQSKKTPEDEAAEAAALAPLAKVTQAEAEATATAKVSGKVLTAELEDEDGTVVWTVRIQSAVTTVTHVQIDAVSGAILATKAHDHTPPFVGSITVDEETLPEDETAEATALAALAKISQADAEAAATAKVSGTIVKTRLEAPHGSVVWSVEIRTSATSVSELKIDAGNGAVLETKTHDGTDSDGNDAGGDND